MFPNKSNLKTVLFLMGTILPFFTTLAEQFEPLPKGLMLNLDFNQVEEGLIRNKTLYPLDVPLGDLGIIPIHNRKVLGILQGQHLDIPHSSLLDPDGSEWITTIRIYAQTNGIVLSQGNDESGYTIYLKEGAVHAAIRTGHSAVILKESRRNGITHCLNTWVTIELRMKPDSAILSLNRHRVALIPLPSPLIGENHRIRMGEHKKPPIALQHNTTLSTSGFSGAVSSLKILRQ